MKRIIIILVSCILGMTIMVGCGSEKIKMPDLDKKINLNSCEFDYSEYEKNGENIKVTLVYNSDVLRVGIINTIRNYVVENLGNEYKEIDLTIIQEKPEFDSVNYIYKNKSWDKEVE